MSSYNEYCEYSKVGVLFVIYFIFSWTFVTSVGLGFGSGGGGAHISLNNNVCNKYGARKKACLDVVDGAFHEAEEACSNYVSLLDGCRSVNAHTCNRDKINVDACYTQVMDAYIRDQLQSTPS